MPFLSFALSISSLRTVSLIWRMDEEAYFGLIPPCMKSVSLIRIATFCRRAQGAYRFLFLKLFENPVLGAGF